MSVLKMEVPLNAVHSLDQFFLGSMQDLAPLFHSGIWDVDAAVSKVKLLMREREAVCPRSPQASSGCRIA